MDELWHLTHLTPYNERWTCWCGIEAFPESEIKRCIVVTNVLVSDVVRLVIGGSRLLPSGRVADIEIWDLKDLCPHCRAEAMTSDCLRSFKTDVSYWGYVDKPGISFVVSFSPRLCPCGCGMRRTEFPREYTYIV